MKVTDPFEIALPARRLLVSDRWLLRLFVLAMVIFAVSMAALVLSIGVEYCPPIEPRSWWQSLAAWRAMPASC